MVGTKYFIAVFMFVLAMTLFLSVTSANFNPGNPISSLKSVYGPSENIEGWINISLTNEPSNSLFSDTRGNSIKLEDLLKTNEDYTSSCSPVDCQADYSADTGGTMKSFNLNSGESEIFGIKLSGDITNINSISFDVSSNAPVSCNNQLKIDFLDDGAIEAQNEKSSGEVCSSLKNYGCFDSGHANPDEFIIDVAGNRPFCQIIGLPEAPGFEIGAWVRNISGLSETLVMALYDNDGNEVSTCELPKTMGSGGEVGCSVDYLVVESGDHYVCIYSQGSGSGLYGIKGYSDFANGCGFYDRPLPSSTNAAYQIFAQGEKFDSVGTLKILNSPPNEDSLSDLVEDYIFGRYGINPDFSLDCSNDCVIPIRFFSGENQVVTIKNLTLDYQKTAGRVIENDFYDLNETPAIINSEFQKLYLDQGNFSVPDNIGNYTFSLDLDNVNIFSEKVSVKDVPKIKSVIPTATASAFPTEFEVMVTSSRNLSNYFWDFGDNSGKVTTKTNKTTHTYQSTGLYNLMINVTDEDGFSDSEVFEINVSLPKEVIKNTLKDMKKNIETVKIQISAFDSFSRESLNSTLRISFIDKELENLETNFSLAISEEDYNQILSRLLQLRVPESVFKTVGSNPLSFYPEEDNVDVDILQAIGGGSYDTSKRGGYVNAILSWNLENLETKIIFTEFSAKYGPSTEPTLNVFELEIKEIGVGLNSYLIINKLDDLKFDKDYQESEEQDYVYINLIDLSLPATITFSTTEDTDFINLPAFISPPVSELSIRDEVTEYVEEEDKPKLIIFILIILFLLIIGVITYIVLQQWYKKKYEDYLFKNKTDLYNMVTYVNNAKKRGLKRKEIGDNLKKAGWSSEKVGYVMKKYSGKRTGMLEIPVTNVLNKLKKKRRF